MPNHQDSAAERNGDERPSQQQSFEFAVSNTIFSEYRRLGDALWLYLFYIDRTTKERVEPDGTVIGLVLGGVPKPDSDAASALGVTDRTIRRWRARLEDESFIRTKQTGHGCIVEVVNSKKYAWKRRQKAEQTGRNRPSRPERNGRSDRKESSAPYIDSTGTVHGQTPLASADAGAAAQPLPEKRTDPRFSTVKDFYITGFQKQNPGVKAVFDGSDGKALKSLLEQQPDATIEQIIGWLRNAFRSDDVPPLRKGFRFRQFACFHTQYVQGALGSDGVKRPLPEKVRRRSPITPDGLMVYEKRGTSSGYHWHDIIPKEFPDFDFENLMPPDVCRICRHRDGECKCAEPRFGNCHRQISSA